MTEPVRAYGPTTMETLEQALSALELAAAGWEEGLGDVPYSEYKQIRNARDAVQAELKRWEVPQTSIFGAMRVAPNPIRVEVRLLGEPDA